MKAMGSVWMGKRLAVWSDGKTMAMVSGDGRWC